MTDIEYDDEINLALGVTNLERSVAFFGERLGFQKLFVDPKNRWATLGTFVQGVTLGLSEVETAPGRGGATPTFGVRDLDAVRSRLEAAEVAFDGNTVEIPGVTKFATFFDPDGNAFMLAQKLR
ncbi:MAG: VOC family protein [Deltaproteobacteria bacterium]|nr:VOC family protein [Deltaproteobacteria bacterium]